MFVQGLIRKSKFPETHVESCGWRVQGTHFPDDTFWELHSWRVDRTSHPKPVEWISHIMWVFYFFVCLWQKVTHFDLSKIWTHMCALQKIADWTQTNFLTTLFPVQFPLTTPRNGISQNVRITLLSPNMLSKPSENSILTPNDAFETQFCLECCDPTVDLCWYH